MTAAGQPLKDFEIISSLQTWWWQTLGHLITSHQDPCSKDKGSKWSRSVPKPDIDKGHKNSNPF